MKKQSKTIVFFGSGPVAAKSLQLLQQNFEVEAVITKPTTKTQMLTAGPPGAKLFCASDKTGLEELFKKERFSSNLGVVVDFGIIISRQVIDSFDKGIVNSHFSLLPEWRGADPIVFSILSGQKETGVSLMLINERLDEGDLLAQEKITIGAKAIEPELTSELIKLSNKMLEKYLPLYLSGQLEPYPQDLSRSVTYSKKLTKADGTINWKIPAIQIEREIRAYYSWPKSRTTLKDNEIIIREATVSNISGGTLGEYEIQKNKLLIHSSKGSLDIKRIQPIGKNEMPIEAFLAGYKNRL